MIRLTVYIILALLIALGAVWIANSPGEMILTWQVWEIRLSFAFFCLLVLFYTLICWYAYKLYRWFLTDNPLKGPRRLDARRKRGLAALEQGWSALAIDNQAEAQKAGKKALDLLNGEAAPLRLLIKASEGAAQEKYLDLLLGHEDSEIYSLKIQIENNRAENNRAAALEKAHLLYAMQPKNPWILNCLLDLYREEGQWDKAREIFNIAQKAKAFPGEEMARKDAFLYYCSARETDIAGQKKKALDLCLSALKKDPALAAAAVLAARLSVALDDEKRAEKILTNSWSRKPQASVAKQFLTLYSTESAQEKLVRVKRLVATNPDNLLSRHLLAQSAIAAHQWPLAKEALDQVSHNAEATALTHILQAQLESDQKGDLEAVKHRLEQAEALIELKEN